MNVHARSSSTGLCLASALAAASLVLAAASAPGQSYRNLSSVHDGSGLMSTNTVTLPANGDGSPVAFKHVSAAGQPGGISTNANGAMKNYAGFLQAVDIKHWTQVDKYGNPYELTPDNDADGLSDVAEVGGSGFSPVTGTDPNREDSDGDGYADGAEAAAGTNPMDTNGNLRILAINNVAGQRQVTYLARSSKNYTIRGQDSRYAYPTNDLGTDMEVGGSGAWEVRTNTFTDAGSTNARFYAIQPQVP